MAGNGYYPPEYGIEIGERCGRGNCSGRMVLADTSLCDNCVYGEDADRCFCAPAGSTECGVCGDDPRFD